MSWERAYVPGQPGWRRRVPGVYRIPVWGEVEAETRRLDALARVAARQPRVVVHRNLLPPGYLHRGYGGSERWPFSIARALKQRGYRQGILKALDNAAYNSSWRYWARSDMEKIVGPRLEENVWNGVDEASGLQQFLYELAEEEERREFAK